MDKLQGNFFMCSNSLLDEDMSVYAKMVYITLKRFAGKNDECYPSIAKICKQSGVKSPNTVYKALNVLEEKCFLSKTHQSRTNGGYRSNKYKLLK